MLLLRVIFEWLRLIGVSAYAALVIRGSGAPVCFLTHPCLVMSNDFGKCADCRMMEPCLFHCRRAFIFDMITVLATAGAPPTRCNVD